MHRTITPLFLLLSAFASAQYPVACYPFVAGSGADASGNGFNGTVVGAVAVPDRAGTPDLYELADSAPAPIPGASDPVITEGAPFVTEDCLTLYFASSQTGGLDLYVMTRPTLDGAWSNPQSSTGTPTGDSTSAIPDGIRLQITLPPGQALTGQLTRDWVNPVLGGGRS